MFVTTSVAPEPWHPGHCVAASPAQRCLVPLTNEEEIMTELSELLAMLSARTAKVEDVVAAATDRDRQRLEAQRAELHATLTAAEDSAATATSSWWAHTRAGADEWFAQMRVTSAARRAEHDRKRAEQLADGAEADASDAVEFAVYALAQAEAAVVEAALARADADAITG
jgi:hypothetical protein